MKYPEFLKKNGTIGVAAPSFGAAWEPYKSAFENASDKFKAGGYQMEVGANVYASCGIGISNTPEKCAEELERFYCAETNDILISCGGGELMCEDLPYLDFEKISNAKPKWYMGYSDNTNFTFPLETMCDVASVYGHCAPTFGMEPWHPCLQEALDLLTGASAVQDADGYTSVAVHDYDLYETEGLKDEEHPYAPYNCTEPALRKVYTDGKPEENGSAFMEGRLIGGCLDILCMHVGTEFDHVAEFNERYKEDGIIWFLESCDLNPMSMRRALWQMENAGWFRYVKGFMIGRPAWGNEAMFGFAPEDAYCGILGKYNVPIILGMDFGHVPPSMPIIAGSYGKIRCDKGNITAEYVLK